MSDLLRLLKIMRVLLGGEADGGEMAFTYQPSIKMVCSVSQHYPND